ncbi:unnamed protein product [Camellia sinensis]
MKLIMPRQNRVVEGLIPGSCKIRKRGCSSSSSSSSSFVLQNYRFKRAILVGKPRGSISSTPVPSWRTTAAALDSPKYAPSQSGGGRSRPVSARNLVATLWEMNEVPLTRPVSAKPSMPKAYNMRNAGAVIHSHGMESCLVTMINPLAKEFRITHMEMIKGIQWHGYYDELVVPIIENTAHEWELTDSLAEACTCLSYHWFLSNKCEGIGTGWSSYIPNYNPSFKSFCLFFSTGGVTYCAVASLRYSGFIEDDVLSKDASSSIINVPLLLDWSLQRLAANGGFQGRPNKPSDTCYAFWVGGVLRILGGHKFIDEKALRQFLLTLPVPAYLLDLPEYDTGGEKPSLDWNKRMHIALGAAHGLLYLHEQCNPRIIHRDVKAANILLDERFEAVVGDFGLAKLLDLRDSHVTTAVRGTVEHIAPEYLSTGRSSEKTDVFGFGILLLELVTGQKALDAENGQIQKGMILDWVRTLYAEKRLEVLVDRDLKGMC